MMGTTAPTLCHWHEYELRQWRSMYRDWPEREPGWIIAKITECLDCQGVERPVRHLNRDLNP